MNTDLRGINLSKVTGISGQQLRVAIMNDTTQQPTQTVNTELDEWGDLEENFCWKPPQLAT